MAKQIEFFAGITRRRWTGFILIWVIIFLLFAFLYINARRSFINEIRYHAMDVAIAVAAAISPDDIAQISQPADSQKEAYKRIQQFLGNVARAATDIRYIYTMRRSEKSGAKESDYEYIVDGPASDINQNGSIGKDEICEPPGKPYDAASLPDMVNAWNKPSADPDISPDPPYPDLMSGYAPIKNPAGTTVALVGVDITASEIQTKLLTLQGALLFVGLIFNLLVVLVMQLLYKQEEVLERILPERKDT